MKKKLVQDVPDAPKPVLRDFHGYSSDNSMHFIATAQQ
jgi:hypothetical protein